MAGEHATAGGAGSAGGMERRGALGALSAAAMTAALVGSYGTFAAMAGRFLLPSRERRKAWLLVSDVASFARGSTRTVVAPTGERIVVARRAGAENAAAREDEFVALSSTCPHLGCQVRFEPQNQRFFCPCHNGTFDADGHSTGGPPFEARQSLPRYPLKLDASLLFIEVPVEGIA